MGSGQTDLADLWQRDVVVLFDYRGYEVNTFETRVGPSYAAHASFCSPTPWLSPITGLAAHLLVNRCGSPSPFDTFVSAVALAEAIGSDVALQLGR